MSEDLLKKMIEYEVPQSVFQYPDAPEGYTKTVLYSIPFEDDESKQLAARLRFPACVEFSIIRSDVNNDDVRYVAHALNVSCEGTDPFIVLTTALSDMTSLYLKNIGQVRWDDCTTPSIYLTMTVDKEES